MPPLLLFDIDLTLIHTDGAGRRAMTTAFQRLYGIAEPTRGIVFEGRTDHAIFMEAIALNALADGDLEGVYRRTIEAYLDELPRSMVATGGGRVLPGVAKLLDELDSRGVVYGLATGNLRQGAAIKLGHYGLWERFAAGGFGEDSPVRADVVRRGIEALASVVGVDPGPENAVVVGDTPLDIEAAHLAGAVALGVGTGSYGVEQLRASGADHALSDLADTERVLTILLDG
jgi:phosphoglycolate phosphatase-like HAD superfamily hydrolase